MIRTRIAPRIALGIAAAAVSLASLVSVAAPASADQLFKPDLRVKYKGETGVGSAHFYQFEVKNIGQSESTQAIFAGTLYRAEDNSIELDTKSFEKKLAPLDPGQSTTVTVPCNDKAGLHAPLNCVGAKMSAVDPDDIDTSNNTARHGRTI